MALPSILKGCAAVALAASLMACGEKPQTAGTTHADKSHAWNGPATGFTAPGWKPGDQAAWDEQIKQRSRGQNDYARMVP